MTATRWSTAVALAAAGVVGGCAKGSSGSSSEGAPSVEHSLAVPDETAPSAVAPPPSGPASSPRGRFVNSDAEPFAFAVEPDSIELGVLRPDEDSDCAFEIVNRDSRPLRLVNIDGSCDCVAFEYTRGDLPPGTRRKVVVKVKAENRGNKVLTVFVQANDRVVTTHELAIRYSIEPALVFEPPRADFGQRVIGSPGRLEVRVRYRLPIGCEPLTLAPKWVTEVPATFELGGARAEPSGGGLVDFDQPLVLVLEASHAFKSFKSELLFEGVGHRRSALPVTGSVHAETWLDPAELHLGVTEVGKLRQGAVRLRWTVEPVNADEITCSVPELRAQASPERGARALRIQVEFEPKVSGEFAGDVTIRTKQAEEPLVLRVRAKVR